MEILSVLGLLAVPAAWSAALWARSSAREAKRLADIEAARRHDECEPKVSVRYEREGEDRYLYFVNEGPSDLAEIQVGVRMNADRVLPVAFFVGPNQPHLSGISIDWLYAGDTRKVPISRTLSRANVAWLSLTCKNRQGEVWDIIALDKPAE